MEYTFPRYSAIAALNNYTLNNLHFEQLQVSDPLGICFAVRIFAKVCNPNSIVGNFSNSRKNERTVSIFT